jgi:phosphoribosylaminoimidazole carboxylase (NCAIR synthetase)
MCDAARRLATGADAVTLEIEQIGVDALSELRALLRCAPGVEPIRIIQDKTLQRSGSPMRAFRWRRFAWWRAKRNCRKQC